MFLFGNTNWLPSLRVQWIIGALFAMLPLLAGMVYAIKVMDEHNRDQGKLVVLSSQLSAAGVILSDQAKDLERVARQYQLLKDERFRSVFIQKYQDLGEQLKSLSVVLVSHGPMETVTRLAQDLERINHLMTSESVPTLELLAEHFKQLHGGIKTLNNATAEMLQAQIDGLEERYQDSQWRLIVMGAWVLPGTLILVWLVSVMVLRPIYQLSAAIKRMGKGDWRADIDITGSNEMVSLGESLSWMQTQLRTIETQKHAFLQQITHELKTPLAAIMEAGSLLVDEVPGPLSGSQKNVLLISQENAQNLQTLIQQLLDYNSAAKDNIQELVQVDLKHYLGDKLADLEGLALTRGVQLRLIGDHLNCVVDPVRLSMIVRNLVSNAVQLTPARKLVEVRWGADNEGWWFKVVDQGPGINDDEKERIFEPFYQGGAKRQGSLKGSGIGLAIVKECADFMGANVIVENIVKDKQKTGASFSVYFPVKNV